MTEVAGLEGVKARSPGDAPAEKSRGRGGPPGSCLKQTTFITEFPCGDLTYEAAPSISPVTEREWRHGDGDTAQAGFLTSGGKGGSCLALARLASEEVRLTTPSSLHIRHLGSWDTGVTRRPAGRAGHQLS